MWIGSLLVQVSCKLNLDIGHGLGISNSCIFSYGGRDHQILIVLFMVIPVILVVLLRLWLSSLALFIVWVFPAPLGINSLHMKVEYKVVNMIKAKKSRDLREVLSLHDNDHNIQIIIIIIVLCLSHANFLQTSVHLFFFLFFDNSLLLWIKQFIIYHGFGFQYIFPHSHYFNFVFDSSHHR